MANDRDNSPQVSETRSTNNIERNPTEQFNELSELSLEERMNAADQMGIPVAGIATTSLGAIGNQDDAEESATVGMNEEDTSEDASR